MSNLPSGMPPEGPIPADTPVPPATERVALLQPNQSPCAQGLVQGRRAFFSIGVRSAALAVVGAIGAIDGFTGSEKALKNAERDAPVAAPTLAEVSVPSPDLDANELTERRIQIFEYVFGKLGRESVLLVDQNFNAITGGPIPVSQYILNVDARINAEINSGTRAELVTLRDQLFQEWINAKRQELQKQYPTIELNIDPNRQGNEEPELISMRPSLSTAPLISAKIEQIRANAQHPVQPGVQNSPSRYDFIKTTLAGSTLPSSLQVLLPGLVGVESSYTTGAVSGVGAKGPWQIMPDLGKELGLVRTIQTRKNIRLKRGRTKTIFIRSTVDERGDFQKSTKAIISFFENIYRKIKENGLYQAIAKAYGLQSEEDFIFPCVIDAYHSGPARVAGMITWFANQYEIADVKNKLGNPPYGKDIYSLMSCEYAKSGQDTRYFKKSRDYYAQVAAVADLLSRDGADIEFDETYTPPAGDIPEAVLMTPQRSASPGTQQSSEGIGVPVQSLLAITAGAAFLATQGNSPVTRRAALVNTAKSFGAGLAGYLGGFSLGGIKVPKDRPEEPKQPSVVPTAPAEKGPAKTTIEIPVANAVYEPKAVNASLQADKAKLNVPLFTDAERSALRATRNPQLKIAADAQKLKPFEKLADLRKAGNDGRLVPLRERAEVYRLRGVGNPKGGPNNNMEYSRVFPQTVQVIEAIGAEVNKRAHEAGLPKKYQVRLIVTSAARTKEYQDSLRKKNRNAGRWSSHTLGNTFDITWQRFDVIDTATGKFTMLTLGDPLNKELKLATSLEVILGRVVSELITQDKVMAIWEAVNQSALHVMSL